MDGGVTRRVLELAGAVVLVVVVFAMVVVLLLVLLLVVGKVGAVVGTLLTTVTGDSRRSNRARWLLFQTLSRNP